MGYPGAGKTTISRILSGELEMKVLDVDDDVLEKKWGMPVSEKVSSGVYSSVITLDALLQCFIINNFSSISASYIQLIYRG